MRGAYGLRIESSILGGDFERAFLLDAGIGWPKWEICWEQLAEGDPAVEGMIWSLETAALATQPDGYISIDRRAARTTLHLRNAPSPAALIHPYLSSTCMIANHWLDRAPFHAGSFEFEGMAWGVLGGREMGKSSLLMCLHQRNIPILADDLLVLNGGTAYTGPRCLDLRKGAAGHFEAGAYLGVVGARERWRVTLPPAPSETPFGGWVLLGWADDVTLPAPSLSNRLAALASNRALTKEGTITNGLLDLLEYPMVIFARPRDWEQMDGATTQLLEALSGLTSGSNHQAEISRAAPA
jgi:hypothetical protein